MHLQKILVKIQTDTEGHADTATDHIDITDKVKCLVRLLDATWSPNVRGLIFVEQRAVVAALASLLREKALTSSTWSIGGFVGTSSFANRKANLADLAESKEQTQDLKDFYCGKKNLMITTSVLEEGIDVSKWMGRRVTRTTRQARLRRKNKVRSQQSADKAAENYHPAGLGCCLRVSAWPGFCFYFYPDCLTAERNADPSVCRLVHAISLFVSICRKTWSPSFNVEDEPDDRTQSMRYLSRSRKTLQGNGIALKPR